MRLIDEIYLEYPFEGSRRMREAVADRHGVCVNRKRVRRLMRLLGLEAPHPGPRTTRRRKVLSWRVSNTMDVSLYSDNQLRTFATNKMRLWREAV